MLQISLVGFLQSDRKIRGMICQHPLRLRNDLCDRGKIEIVAEVQLRAKRAAPRLQDAISRNRLQLRFLRGGRSGKFQDNFMLRERTGIGGVEGVSDSVARFGCSSRATLSDTPSTSCCVSARALAALKACPIALRDSSTRIASLTRSET